MNISKHGTLNWDLDALSLALKINKDNVIEYFTDGRRVSFIIERRLAKEILHGDISNSEGASYDLIDCNGQKWEVRSISASGVYFCPSYMVGSGRSFQEPGFLDKLNLIEGYILSDITEFPTISYWLISTELVRSWYSAGLLGENTKVSRAKILNLINDVARNGYFSSC